MEEENDNTPLFICHCFTPRAANQFCFRVLIAATKPMNWGNILLQVLRFVVSVYQKDTVFLSWSHKRALNERCGSRPGRIHVGTISA